MTNAVCEVAENSDSSKMKTEYVSLVNYEIQHVKLLVATTMWYDILLAVNTEGKTLQFCKTKILVIFKQNKDSLIFCKKYQKKKRVSPLPRGQQYKWPRKRRLTKIQKLQELECFYPSGIELSWHVTHDSNMWMNMLAIWVLLTVSRNIER
jgi:hypothetical protein